MTLSSMDYWRLSDELSAIDAAILMTGNDPSAKDMLRIPESREPFYDENGRPREIQRTDYDGFYASFKALKNAIMSNSLKAIVRLPLRKALHPHIGENDTARSEDLDDFATESEKQFSYEMLIARPIEIPTVIDQEYLEKGQTYSNFDIKISKKVGIYILAKSLIGMKPR